MAERNLITLEKPSFLHGFEEPSLFLEVIFIGAFKWLLKAKNLILTVSRGRVEMLIKKSLEIRRLAPISMLKKGVAILEEGYEQNMLDCVGLGFHCVDLLMRISEMPSFKEHRSTHVLNFDIQGGGPVSTGLVAMAELGAKVGYVGKVGDDYWGDFILKEYKKYGVDTSRIIVEKGRTSPCVAVLVEAATGVRVFMILPSNLTSLKFAEPERSYIENSRMLFLAGGEREMVQAAKIAKAAGIPVFIDGLARGELKGLVDVAICGEEYAHAMTHTHDPLKAVEKLSMDGYSIVGITLGSKGSIFKTEGKIIRQEAFQVKVVDTTGAGDVFHGAFAYAILQGWDIEKTVEFASAVSALKCTKLGGRSGIPTLDETLKFINEYKNPYFQNSKTLHN